MEVPQAVAGPLLASNPATKEGCAKRILDRVKMLSHQRALTHTTSFTINVLIVSCSLAFLWL